MAGQEKTLCLLRHLPAITLFNINHPGAIKRSQRKRGRHGGKTHGAGTKGASSNQSFTPAGFESFGMPTYLKVPREFPYKDHHMRRQYLPISLHEIQLLVDVDRIDTTQMIDIAQICRTRMFKLNPEMREFGFQLVDEGIDRFKAKVHLEVQYATERVISAVERNGGSVTTAYYDAFSVTALKDPLAFFRTGRPIPRRLLPPKDLVAYYTDPCARGYLADPAQVAADRLVLAQKYGYPESAVTGEEVERKDPRQVFYGLEPGWLVNLADKAVYRCKDADYNSYCKS